MTVSSGKITSITILSSSDDRQFFNMAQSTVINSILSARSIDVQTAGGATFSSNGILESVANALELDFTNPNFSMQGAGGHGSGHHRGR